MPVESSDPNSDNPLDLLQRLKESSFSELLTMLLKGRARKDLLEYAAQRGFEDFQQSTIDRYFNGRRVPSRDVGDSFIQLLAEFAELDQKDRNNLKIAVDMRRKGQMKP
jgi:predicted CopG family antitoxin